MHEIGSEFSFIPIESGKGISFPRGRNNSSLVFSGRTAIERVLTVIGNKHKALLPSYCCDSMIEPFRKSGMPYSFYDVYYDHGLMIDLTIPDDTDVLVWCDYFGFTNQMPDLRYFTERGGIIIEDITHSYFSQEPCHAQSQYLVASLRKWEPVLCGGFCNVTTAGLVSPPESFITGKKAAMLLKAEYLQDQAEDKKEKYLEAFSRWNHWIQNHYSGLDIDSYSRAFLEHADAEAHRKKRIRNAHVLYQGLKGKVEFLFDEQRIDCPLFVPVILIGNRNEVRERLIGNRVYCPVHWPKPTDNCKSNLYDYELSLICDQRYSDKDMSRIASFFN